MDYQQTDGPAGLYSAAPPPPPPHTPPPPPREPRGSGWRIFWAIVLAMSIVANIVLLFMIFAMAAVFISGPGQLLEARSGYVEEVLQKGPAAQKIAVIRVEGLIDSSQRDKFKKQMKAVKADPNVRALIIRTVTPGGTVSASDEMHHEIQNFRQETGKPVVAFMQTVAASGGYYTSVACDKIVAEPTAITGSIGVIMTTFVLKDLLENKLGIDPLVIKSGPKKDWPSMFSEPTEEQKQYLNDRLIQPAYQRFLSCVIEGRKNVLTPDEVRKLADGSIFVAEEAQQKGLIDKVGYLADAIATTEELAGITEARVVEYAPQFSLSTLLGAESKARLWEIDQSKLHELAGPQLMYLWDARP